MNTPYYEQDGITIYHGDCREIQWPTPKFCPWCGGSNVSGKVYGYSEPGFDFALLRGLL
jgi:hypothetical protein